MKTCTKCGIVKELDCFYFRNNKFTTMCKECSNYASKTWYENNSLEKNKNLRLKYHSNEEYRKKDNIRSRQYTVTQIQAWRIENPDKYKEYLKNKLFHNRVSQLKQYTPNWADIEAIKQFYMNCPKGMHVDHIIPINGPNVSGLHVENNLQYLTPLENKRKGNKYFIG